MSSLTGKELQIVEALSSADLSEKMIGTSCIKDLLGNLEKANQETSTANDALQKLRKEKKDGNLVTNWWNDSDDRIKDAQITLSTSVANLNRHSSQLLIFNTAISKILIDQQKLLLQQQKLLEQQTKDLHQQNATIFEHQKALQTQQEEISKANQGLLEAKGVTAEQAQKLIGCVQRVEIAEQRIAEVNGQLLLTIGQRINATQQEMESSLTITSEKLEVQEKQLQEYAQQQQQQRLIDQSNLHQELESRLEYLGNTLLTEQQKHLDQNMAFFAQRTTETEQRIGVLTQQYKKFSNRMTLIIFILGTTLAGLVGTNFFL